MEGGHNKGTKVSSSEASSPEPTTGDPGAMRPYYECMFCKRGFTTAQALGGHMNLHRKDRARMQHGRMVSSVSGKAEENLEGYGYNIPYSYDHRVYSQISESLKSYSFCVQASSSDGRDSRVARDGDDMGLRRQRELSDFGKDLHPGLGMHFDGSNGVCEEEKRNYVDVEEELDLELRLGRPSSLE